MIENRHQKIPITIQTVIINFILIASALFLIGFLSYDNFEKRYVKLRNSAYKTLATEIKGAIEDGLALGLSCEELQTTPAILSNAREGAEDIHSMAVLNRSGVAIFELNGDSSISDTISIKLQLETLDSSICFSDNNNNTVLVTPLFNSFKVVEGYLILEYSTLDIEMIKTLKKRTSLLLVALLAIVLIPLIIIVRHLVAPVLVGIEMMEKEFLSEEDLDDEERNEILYTAKKTMERALNELSTDEGGQNE